MNRRLKAMYGAQSNDLANALMADRHRYAAQVGRERSARRSLPLLPKVRRNGQSITAMLGAAVAGIRLALARPRPGTTAY